MDVGGPNMNQTPRLRNLSVLRQGVGGGCALSPPSLTAADEALNTMMSARIWRTARNSMSLPEAVIPSHPVFHPKPEKILWAMMHVPIGGYRRC